MIVLNKINPLKKTKSQHVIKKNALAFFGATAFAATLFPWTSAYANGVVTGRVIELVACTENSGVLTGQNLAIAKVSLQGGGIRTLVIYSTHPDHNLDRSEHLIRAIESQNNGKILNFYWTDNEGSNICGVSGRYNFLSSVRS